jgi:hypothetical protein
MSRFFLVLVFSLVAVWRSAAEEQKFLSDEGQIIFNLPSGNIGCVYTPKGGTSYYEPEDGGPELQCDRQEPVYLRFFLRKSGKAEKFKNVGDVGCCGANNILRYGNSWSKNGFRCASERTGLTCTRGKNGFVISRSRAVVY